MSNQERVPWPRRCSAWLGVVLLGVVVLTACGGGAPTPAQPPAAAPRSAVSQPLTAPAAPSVPAWQADWEKTLAAAKKEGKVVPVLWTARDRAGVEKFSETYPEIKVESAVIPPQQASIRIPEERSVGIYSYDVHYGGINPGISVFLPTGTILGEVRPLLVLPDVVDSTKWVGGIEDHWVDDVTKNVMLNYTATVSLSTLWVNTQKLPQAEQFRRLEDFFKPEYASKWCHYDPRVGGPGLGSYSRLVLTKGKDYAQMVLRDLKPVISRDQRKMTEDLIRGDFLFCVAPALEDFHRLGVGLHVKEVRLDPGGLSPEYAGKLKVTCCGVGKTKGTLDGWGSAAVGGPAIYQKAPHPNAAKVFINWFLSREGSLTLLEAGGFRQCSPRLDLQEKCSPPEKRLQDGNTYVFFDRASNLEYDRVGIGISQEILGR